jgi:DNA gyrase/topoisomerase IV subunit A
MSLRDEVHAADQARVDVLTAMITGIERRSDVLAAIESAPTSETAVSTVAQLLSLDTAAATAVLDLQLRRLTAAELARLKAERDGLRDRLSSSA